MNKAIIYYKSKIQSAKRSNKIRQLISLLTEVGVNNIDTVLIIMLLQMVS